MLCKHHCNTELHYVVIIMLIFCNLLSSNEGNFYLHYFYFITSNSEVEALLLLLSSFCLLLLLVLLSDLSEALDVVKAFKLASRASFSLISPLYAVTTSGNSSKSLATYLIVIKNRLCYIKNEYKVIHPNQLTSKSTFVSG